DQIEDAYDQGGEAPVIRAWSEHSGQKSDQRIIEGDERDQSANRGRDEKRNTDLPGGELFLHLSAEYLQASGEEIFGSYFDFIDNITDVFTFVLPSVASQLGSWLRTQLLFPR